MVNWGSSSDTFFLFSGKLEAGKEKQLSTREKAKVLWCRSWLRGEDESKSIKCSRWRVGRPPSTAVVKQEVWHWEHRKWLLWRYANSFAQQLQGLGSIQLNRSCSSFSSNNNIGDDFPLKDLFSYLSGMKAVLCPIHRVHSEGNEMQCK